MPTITLSTDTKDAVLNALKAKIDSGGAAGSIKIYTGAKPAGPGTAISNQVLLGTLALSYPCGDVVDGALTFDPITQDSQADATGTATWARILASDGSAKADVDASVVGGAGFMQMNTTSVIINGPILINSCVITA